MIFKDEEFCNCIITTDTGEQYRVYSNFLHINDLTFWKGWECDAGSTRIHIDKNADVYNGRCEDTYLGNLKTGWHINNQPVICSKERCSSCIDDLTVGKNKV